MAIKTYNDQNFVAIANAIRSKSKNPTTYKPSEMAAAISAIESGFELLPQDTVSGAIANFPDGSNNYPVVELVANIDYKQEGSTECNISKQGKNLFDKNNANIVTGYIGTSAFSEGNANAKTIYIPITPGVTYTVSKTAGQRFQIATSNVIPTNGATYTSRQSQSGSTTSLTITAGSNDTYLWAWIFLAGTDTGTLEDMVNSVQIEVGSTATAYEPYSAPEVKTISWESEAGTVYGGTLNVTTGELTSTLDSSGDPLPTPEVYQLEPEEVKTLLGVNNIYADTGNVSVTYRADIDLYIAKKIAEGA